MRIGAHVGVGGGWVEAVRYCAEVGAECMQVFTKSPRTWRAAALPGEAKDSFRRAREEHDIGPVFAHTSYLINLGSSDSELRGRSIAALAVELARAEAIGADALITHVGTDAFGDTARARDWIADAIRLARETGVGAGVPVELLLENSAGAGRQFGASLTDVGALAEAVDARGAGPVGVCLDTCHAFAAGYEFDSVDAWSRVLDDLREGGASARVRVVHANDCSFGRGARRDRHAWIGAGEMGLESFRALFRVDELRDVPIVVEMPGEVPAKDATNISVLKDLRSKYCVQPHMC